MTMVFYNLRAPCAEAILVPTRDGHLERVLIAPAAGEGLVEKCREYGLPVYLQYLDRRNHIRFWPMGFTPPPGWRRSPPGRGGASAT